jgi:two-component system nitrate/nitrite response regulator NarL
MTNHSVVLIDASRLFREGLRRLFSDSTSLLSVVHESVSIEEALPFVGSLQPSLILVDLPDVVVELASHFQQIRAAAPRTRIVVLTDTMRVDRLSDALSAGVDGYLLKTMSSDALHQSLRLVLLGEKVFPTDLAHLLTEGRIASRHDVGQASKFNDLSNREMQILGCLLSGAQNKQIAYELKISDGTVKVHLKTILKKIRVQNRTQAAIWAMNNGIAKTRGADAQRELAVA